MSGDDFDLQPFRDLANAPRDANAAELAEVMRVLEERAGRREAAGTRVFSAAEIRAEATVIVTDLLEAARAGELSPGISARRAAMRRNVDTPRMADHGGDMHKFAADAISWLQDSAGRGSYLADLQAAHSAITRAGQEPDLDAQFESFILGRLDGSIDHDTAARMRKNASRTARRTRQHNLPEPPGARSEQHRVAIEVLKDAIADAGGLSVLRAEPLRGWHAFMTFASQKTRVAYEREDASEGPLLLFEWGTPVFSGSPSTYVRAIQQFEIYDKDGGPDYRQIGLNWTFENAPKAGSGAIWEDDGDWSELVERSEGFGLLSEPADRITVIDELTE